MRWRSTWSGCWPERDSTSQAGGGSALQPSDRSADQPLDERRAGVRAFDWPATRQAHLFRQREADGRDGASQARVVFEH